MEKMVDAAERVTELEKNYKMDVKNLEKRWEVLKQWSDDYSLELRKIVLEWKLIKQEQQVLVEWLDPNEKQLSKINEKINWADEEGMKKQIEDLKVILVCTKLTKIVLCYLIPNVLLNHYLPSFSINKTNLSVSPFRAFSLN